MTFPEKPKLHLCGANGHLARLLIAKCEHKFELVNYSSKVSSRPSLGQSPDTLPLEALVHEVDAMEVVLFFSHSNEVASHRKIIDLLSKLKTRHPHLIFISSMATHSGYASRYFHHKTELEALVQQYSSWKIIRPGFIFSKHYGGLSQVFRKLAKFNFLLLPSRTAKTYFIRSHVAASAIYELIMSRNENLIVELYEAVLNFEQALKMFGFTGKCFSLPNFQHPKFLALLNYLGAITPSFAQSIISVLFMDQTSYIREDRYYVSRILLCDFLKYFGKSHLLKARHFIREITKTTTLVDYEQLSTGDRYMLHLRLFELINARESQKPFQRAINDPLTTGE